MINIQLNDVMVSKNRYEDMNKEKDLFLFSLFTYISENN